MIKKEKKRLFVPIFIIAILVFSTIGFIFGYSTSDNSQQQTLRYNGFDFIQHDTGRWLTSAGNKQVALINHPQDLEYISFPTFLSLNDLNSANKVYLTYDHNKDIALVLSEFQFLKSYLNKPIIEACTIDIEQCNNKPLKTCDDATQQEKIIHLSLSNKTETITYYDNCIFIEGENILKPVDRFIWKLIGVMK